MARMGENLPIREHMRQRGVPVTEVDDSAMEAPEPTQAQRNIRKKRGGMKSVPVTDSLPPEEAAPAGNPEGFGELLFGSNIPHEVKLAIMQKFEGASPGNSGSIKDFHRSIYESGLEGSLKDKLAQMKSYGDNITANPARKGVPDVASVGPSDSLDPRTGQPWSKKIGPTDRRKLLERFAESAQAPPPPPQSTGGAPTPLGPGGDGASGGRPVTYQSQPAGQMANSMGQGQRIDPRIAQFLMALRQNGGV